MSQVVAIFILSNAKDSLVIIAFFSWMVVHTFSPSTRRGRGRRISVTLRPAISTKRFQDNQVYKETLSQKRIPFLLIQHWPHPLFGERKVQSKGLKAQVVVHLLLVPKSGPLDCVSPFLSLLGEKKKD